MSGWRRRKKRRRPSRAADPAIVASVSDPSEPPSESAEPPSESVEPPSQPTDPNEPASASEIAAGETPPPVVFELPEESADAMPELHLPRPGGEMIEGEPRTERVGPPPVVDLPERIEDLSDDAPAAQADLPEPAEASTPPDDSDDEAPSAPVTAPAISAIVRPPPMDDAPAAERERPTPPQRTVPPGAPRISAPGVELRADRVVHSPLAGPRRRSARDVQLDLEAAEREAASEALAAAGEEDETAALSGSGVSLEPVVPITGLAQAALSPAEIEAATKVAIEQLPGRSTRVETCPFLRSIAGGSLQQPRDTVDGRNRCAAFGEPLPLSRMQQGLVCLQPAHTACPRYVRGALLIQERIAPAAAPPSRLPVQVAAALLALAVLAVVAYLLLGGRLEPDTGVVPTFTATPSASLTASPEPPPTPSPTATPSATPTQRPTPTPTSTPTPRPTQLPAVYRGLQHCPSPQTCYVYVVRRGDTLSSIARRFDTTVPILRRLNPQIRSDFLRVGQKVRVPPP